MKNSQLSTLLLLSLVFCPSSLLQSQTHKIGTFNIRYITTEDKGAHQWSNRKDRVLKIVTDYDFDVIGFNEVTGTNNDGSPRKQGDGTTCNQKNELIEGLSATYNSIAYEREGGLYEHNVLSYKKDKYECLDSYPLYLNDHPKTPGITWANGTENPMARVAVIAHLKVKATGEQFWACAAHTNYGAYEAGIKSARLLAEHLKQVAGEEPIIAVGDFNLNRENQPQAYRGFMWAFEEAKFTAEKIECLPTTNPSVTFTTNNWTPAGKSGCDGAEYDHLFYHNMNCKAYHIITEVYGQSTTPSDHFPLLGEFELVYDHQSTYYVNNEQELDDALAKANPQDTIFFVPNEIVLSKPITPNHSLVFIGAEGKTTITMKDKTQSAFNIPQWYSIELHNIILTGYSSTTLTGGGALYCPGHLLRMRNCELRGCYSQTAGGAVVADVNRLDIENCFFSGNYAKNNGGAVSVNAYETVRMFDNVFMNDTAASGSAVALITCETANIQRSSFLANYSTKHGTFYCLASDNTQSVNFLNCAFLNNTLEAKSGLATVTKFYGGAAINAKMSQTNQKVNVGLCTMMSNRVLFSGSSNFTGAALNIFAGSACVMDNLIVGNTCTMADGSPIAADMNNAITPWRNTKNVFTEDLPHPEELPDTVYITSKLTYQLKQPTLGGYNLQALLTFDRMCETAFEFDLNEDGSISGYIDRDQLNTIRDATKATIGAIEYTGEWEPETGLYNPQSSIFNSQSSIYKIYQNGQIILKNNYSQYNLLGQSL